MPGTIPEDMYHVLVPVDRNTNHAFHQAEYVARLSSSDTDLEATVIHVVPPAEFATMDEAEFADNDAAVRAAEYLDEEGVRVNRIINNGSVSKKVLDAAKELAVDEIVIGGRKRGGVTRVLLGSIAQDLLLSAERPVTVTGGGTVFGDRKRRVLMPVDGNSERALHQAEYVAELPGATEDIEATVLYVFRHQDYAGAPPHKFDEIDAAVDAAAYLEDQGIPVERVSMGGEIASRILDYAEDNDIDSIVMGGRRRSGIQRVLLGSTTEDIVRGTHHPVTLTG